MIEQSSQIQTPEHQTRHEGIYDADVLFDRFEIEHQAVLLIEERAQQPEVPVYRQERRDNARTALMEALTASGHLSRIEITGSIEEINKQVLNRLLNGWDDSLPFHEKQRRFHELCEELVIQRVHAEIVRGNIDEDTAVGIISDFPFKLIDDLGVKKTLRLGYRAYNAKGMTRETHLRKNKGGTYTRVIEQVSRANSDPATTESFFSANRILLDQSLEPDVAALRKPFLFSRSKYIDGIVDVQRQLDWYAGSNILYGDDSEASALHVDYSELREESARREANIECYIERLANLEEQLEHLVKKGMAEAEAKTIYLEQVDRILAAICTLDPDYAEATYGTAAARTFYEAAELYAQGYRKQAAMLLESNSHMRQMVTFCGESISAAKAKEMGLKVNEFGELVEMGKEKWQWKEGVCRVESCSTRPRKTKIGPCSVCKKCQKLFDKGIDPTKRSKPREPRKFRVVSIMSRRDARKGTTDERAA